MNVKEIIEAIGNYSIYVYPGIISIFIRNFLLARNTKIDNNQVINIIAISYIYVFIYTGMSGHDIGQFTRSDYWFIGCMSLFMPIIINATYQSFKVYLEPFLQFIKIDTSLENTVFDRMYCRKNEKVKINRNMFVRIYSSKYPYRYEGVVESYESDPDMEMVICLVRYRILKKKEDDFVLYRDNTSKIDKFLYIKMKEIESMEIEYI